YPKYLLSLTLNGYRR
ncbi:hypothetical protein THAOC_21208, partial [Thalassiosira oceanica]